MKEMKANQFQEQSTRLVFNLPRAFVDVVKHHPFFNGLVDITKGHKLTEDGEHCQFVIDNPSFSKAFVATMALQDKEIPYDVLSLDKNGVVRDVMRFQYGEGADEKEIKMYEGTRYDKNGKRVEFKREPNDAVFKENINDIPLKENHHEMIKIAKEAAVLHEKETSERKAREREEAKANPLKFTPKPLKR